MVTDHDIRKLKTIFATKEDLNRFATKEDLERFAMKEDIKRFATKDDLKGFVTKTEFHSAIHELVALITDGFNRMDEMIATIKEQTKILHDHKRRLDRVEDKVFA